MILMYDSTNADSIPEDAPAAAGYADGRWPSFFDLDHRGTPRRRKSIATDAGTDADILDVENYDAVPRQAPGWYARQRVRLPLWELPWFYANLSTMPDVRYELRNAGIKRSEVILFVANPTGHAHIPPGYDACQYDWLEAYDLSWCRPHCFPSAPAAPVPDPALAAAVERQETGS